MPVSEGKEAKAEKEVSTGVEAVVMEPLVTELTEDMDATDKEVTSSM